MRHVAADRTPLAALTFRSQGPRIMATCHILNNISMLVYFRDGPQSHLSSMRHVAADRKILTFR